MSARVPPLARADIGADALAELRGPFPRADKYLADGPDALPMPPILGLLARHAAIAGPWLGYNGALLERGVLDGRTRELLILATSRRARSAYVWQEHLELAARAGLTPEEVAALAGETARDWPAPDHALLRAVDELVDDHVVADATWQNLSQYFDDQQLLELLFVVGTYTCLAMVLNSTGLVPILDDEQIS